MITREAEEIRLVKERSREAIDLAMRGEWAEAAQINRAILDLSPTNVEAMNRLGKALVELGQSEQARDVFLSALVLHPSNPIALKNVARLRAEAEGQGSRPAWARAQGARASGRFIAESTKSAEVVLLSAGAPAAASPGAPVTLGFRGAIVVVSDEFGGCLGLLPPSLSRRLSALMSGGNQYEGVVVSAGADGVVRVLLREAYQHPSQRAKASFLPALPPPPESALLDEIEAEDVDALRRESAGSPLALLDDEPELAAAGASIGVLDDGVMPELPEEVFA